MISRTKVRRVTIVAQASAVALVLALGAVIVVGAPSGASGGHEEVTIEPVLAGGSDASQAPSGAVPDQSRVDYAGIAARLGQFKNAPTAPMADPEPDDDPEIITKPGQTDEIKYLGMITIGLDRSALLNVDGVQRVVRQGGLLERPGAAPVRVFSVQKDYLVVSEGRERKRLEKAVRESSSVTKIDASALAPKPAGGARPAQSTAAANAGDARGAGAAPREDFEQRRYDAIQKALAEGRIDQEDAERMLERIERMRQEREQQNDR